MYSIRYRLKLIFLLCCLSLRLSEIGLRAEIKLPALISDGMVLQQGTKVTLWGTADPGEQVTVTVNRSEARGVADSEGQWSAKLGPLNAGGPHTVTIAGKNTITLHDVLVGEVWVCSGQSNMAITVGPTRPPYFTGVNNYQEELHAANHPMLRLFTVERAVARKPQRDLKGSWVSARPETVNDFSAVGYFFGRQLLQTLNVPVGMIHSSLGSTTAEVWMRRAALESDPDLKSILESEKTIATSYRKVFDKFERQYEQWKLDSEKAEAEGKPGPLAPKIPDDPRQSHTRPAALYNAMIFPLTFFAIKGVIWYQGESNSDRPGQYRKLFPALIRDWRQAWGQGDFPFLFVQLASWGIQYFQLNFPALREAQSIALTLPNTGMAVTTDIGDGTDGHPKNKQDVGYRLALAAQAIAYGRDVIYTGPTYDSTVIEGEAVRIRFKNANGGLTSRNWPPGFRSGFEIAGEDRKFVEAEASIEGDTVLVRSERVSRPVAVRYNWKDNPWHHLYNRARLPAPPFRTDDWPDAILPR